MTIRNRDRARSSQASSLLRPKTPWFPTLAAAAIFAAAGPGGADAQPSPQGGAPASAAAVDSRWLPWLGCWQLVEETAPLLESADDLSAFADRVLVCVTPAAPPAAATDVVVTTLANDEPMLVETLSADGLEHPVDQTECRGRRRIAWSDDGWRLFTRATLTCGGNDARRLSGVGLILDNWNWLDLKLVEAGERAAVTVRRYRRAGDVATLSAAGPTLTPDLLVQARTAAVVAAQADLSWHFPNAKLYISKLKRKRIAKKFETLSGQFASVISKIFETIDPRSAMDFISGVSASVQYPSLIKPFSDITKDASLSDIFLHLHHFGWNYRQHHLLQSLTEKCGTPELQSSLESYTERLSALEKDMTLAELLWILPQGSPPSRPGFVHMTLTFDTDLNYTVQQLSKFQKLFTHTFQLHPYAVILYTAKTVQSSFKLEFLVPSGVDCILLMQSEEKANFFYEHKISQVGLYDKGCYDFHYSFDQEHCKPVTLKSEAERIKKLAEKLQKFQAETASS